MCLHKKHYFTLSIRKKLNEKGCRIRQELDGSSCDIIFTNVDPSRVDLYRTRTGHFKALSYVQSSALKRLSSFCVSFLLQEGGYIDFKTQSYSFHFSKNSPPNTPEMTSTLLKNTLMFSCCGSQESANLFFFLSSGITGALIASSRFPGLKTLYIPFNINLIHSSQ